MWRAGSFRPASVVLMGLVLLSGCGRVVDDPGRDPGQSVADPQQAWETIRSDSFAVYYVPPEDEAAAAVLRALEVNHDRVMESLRPSLTGPFTVRIYPSVRELHEAMNWFGMPNWVVGSIRGGSELCIVCPSNPGGQHTYEDMLQVAVHEFTHCVTARLAAEAGIASSPLWLWEGVALYMAGQFRDPATLPYMHSGEYPRFLELSDAVASPEIYGIGYVIIEYIVETWGMEAVRSLLLANGDIAAVLGMADDAFYEGWHRFVRSRYID